MKKRLRISQCMIVKDEEKNIKKALEWGKGIVHEQIVVDTGSTDRTAEIAEALGAKVFHFPWIDDFSAAKNYALMQAVGEWIAFLDADEYFEDADARELVPFLEKVESSFPAGSQPHIIRCKMLHLNDQGLPFADSVQDRIFRNLPVLRYHGAIHEQLSLGENKKMRIFNAVDTFTVMHTGYAASRYAETNKAQRNISLLQKELESNPGDCTLMFYYAESLKAAERYAEAEAYLRKIIQNHSESTDSEVVNKTYQNLLRMLAAKNNDGDKHDVYACYRHLMISDPGHPDPHYFFGFWLINRGEFEEARLQFEKALEKLETYHGKEMVCLSGNLEHIYFLLTKSCFALNSSPDTVRYGVLALRINRYQDTVLEALLSLLREEPGEKENPEGTFRFLMKLYDFQLPKDRLFVLKCAKNTAFASLENKIRLLFPESERI